MIESQIVTRSAILAFKLVTQEQVEAGECGIFRRLHILAQRNDGWNFHVQIWTVHMPVVIRNDVYLVEEHRLDCCLPGP